MRRIAGGSGISTATHLASLIRKFPYENNNDITAANASTTNVTSEEKKDETVHTDETNENDEKEDEKEEEEEALMDVTVQTVINENDDYGRLLINHAKESNFELINCRRSSMPQQQNQSTSHCIVMVTPNERSFVSHLGIMETFQPSHTMLHELVQCRSADPTFTNHHHHIHIAGYYNLTKFHEKNSLKKRIKLIREKRRNKSHGQHVYTTTISLTPQHDATAKWSTHTLFDLLPLVDFLILNLLEACKICRMEVPQNEDNIGNDLFVKLADFLDEKSPQTYTVVTLGKLGAVLLYGGDVVHQYSAPAKYDNPLDPTGAGDAFVSGFLFGTMNWRRQRQHNQVAEIGSILEEAGGWTEAIEVGMKWGCATGTACVMKAGASVPSTKSEIELMLNPNIVEEEGFNDNGEEEEEEEDDSEQDSDYTSSDYDDDYDDYSSSYTSSNEYYEDEEA